MTNKAARYLDMALAAYLLISAYLWRHSGPQFLITTLVGAVVVTFAPFAFMGPRVRYANATAGVFLIASAILLHRASAGTAWNNIVVGLAITAVSLVGPDGLVRGRRHPRPL